MVADLRLKGEPGKRGLMFISYYGRSRAFITNYGSWSEYHQEDGTARAAASLLIHETLYIAMNRL